MTAAETERELFESDEFVLLEVAKIQTLYVLKREIRYGLERITELETESVGEHIYGMHCLCDYYLPIIDKEGAFDESKIRTMIQYHDVDEIITGDIPNHEKDNETDGLTASREVIHGLPAHMQMGLIAIITEYHEQETDEAKFVKALDKHEPAFQCYSPEMKKVLLSTNITLKKGMRGKVDYLAYFPIIQRVNQVISDQMITEGFFVNE